MILEKKAKPVLHRQKCPGCGYYTFYRAEPTGEKATDTCTACGHQVEIAWHADIKAIFNNSEKLFRDLEAVCPELKELQKPGDRVRFD